MICYLRASPDTEVLCCEQITATGTEDYCVRADCPDVETEITLCFSGDTTVNVDGKGWTPMQQLSVGDSILTGKNNQYETVYGFAHYQPKKTAAFLVIQGDDDVELEVTAEHLVYLKGKTNPVRADSIQMGDVLTPSGATVINIGTVTKTGLYTPLTPDGTLLVNGGGIKASSYAAVAQHNAEFSEFQDGTKFMAQATFIHLVLSPYRMFCHITSMMGDAKACDAYGEDGLPSYVSWGIKILRWADEQSLMAQVVMFACALAFFGTVMVFEHLLFGRGMMSWSLVLLGVAGVYGKNMITEKSKVKQI